MNGLVLDVKVGGGAFLEDLSSSVTLAETMIGLGRERGCPTVALVSAMDQPLGAACGNAIETAEAIAALNGKIAMGVMSNADDRFLVGALENNGWSFDPVISSETARAYKPDPRAFGAICEATGVAPDRVLYVGDSAYDDAHGAKAAGMTTVLIRRNQDTPGRTPPPDAAKLLEPDHVVSRLTELPALLDSLS